MAIADVAAEPLPGDHPQVPELATIAAARSAADGTVVTVEGVITSEPGLFGGQGFYLQDDTAGVYVFQTASGYHAGDLIRISATRTLYNGEVELENPLTIEKKGTAPLPQPIEQEAVTDGNQGQFITLTDVAVQDVAAASPAGSFEFNAVKGGGAATRVRFDGRTGVDMAAFSALFPAGSKVDITGIASVFRGTYQLKPLSLDHVVLSGAEEDTLAPVTRASASGAAGQELYNPEDVTVYLSAQDEGGSGLERTEYRINGGEWLAYASPILLTEDGKYVIEYRSWDRAGNSETEKTLYINIDRGSPVIHFSGDRQFLQIETEFPIQVDVEDAVSGVKNTAYQLDGRQIAGLHEITPLSLAAGKHKLVVSATDAAGLHSAEQFDFTVTIDIAHLDELVDAGEAAGYVKKGIAQSLDAKISSLQKAKTDRERKQKINVLKQTINAQGGKGINSSFAKLMLGDLEYIVKQAG